MMNPLLRSSRALHGAGLVLLLAAAACGHSSAVRTGDVAYARLSREAPVAVFFDERTVSTPFQVVGQVETEDRSRHWMVTVNDAVPDLSSRARSIGADGIIIDQASPFPSGRNGHGLYVRARAIRRGAPMMMAPTPFPPVVMMQAPPVETTVFVPPPQQVIIVAPPAPVVTMVNP